MSQVALSMSAKCHQQTSLSSMAGSSEELAPQGYSAAGLDQSNHEAKEKYTVMLGIQKLEAGSLSLSLFKSFS